MNRQSKTLLTGILGAALLTLTAGCGGSSTAGNNASTEQNTTKPAPTSSQPPADATPSSTPGNSNAGGTNGSSGQASAGSSAQPTTIPAVVQDALKPYVAYPPIPLMAPTVLPQAKSGSSAISINTYKEDPGQRPGYFVQFLQTPTSLPINQADPKTSPSLGIFRGEQYSSPGDAAQQVLVTGGYWDPSQPDLLNVTGKLDTGTVDFGKGIIGHTYQFTNAHPGGKDINYYAGIAWQEGRWKLEVISQQSLDLATETAKQMAAYLDSNFLPIPETTGTVVVNVSPGTADVQQRDMNTTVTWQRGSLLYQVSTGPATANPVISALQMTVTMSPFTGS